MRTIRSAAALLTEANQVESLVPLVRALGFTDYIAPLDPAGRHALHLDTITDDARVARGPGARRALLVAVDGTRFPIRESISRVASRLAIHSPELLWLVAAVERPGTHLALAAWSADRHPPRTAALVVDRERVVDSDAETFCALEAATNGDDLLTHARWLDVLGRGSLTRRFYRALEQTVGTLADNVTGVGTGAGGSKTRPYNNATADDRRALALLYTSRLLFLSFLEAKGWLDGDRAFIARSFAECVAGAGRYHDRVLRPLFFGTLNTPPNRRARAARALGRVPFLNGGLFAPTPLERRYRGFRFSDEHLGVLVGDLLARYRFTAREDRATWSEAAIDPEMLGKAFESLMQPAERRASGAYYTPQPLVEQVTHETLAHALATPDASASRIAELLRGEATSGPAAAAVRALLPRLRVLDPACGSGAFLVYALESLATLANHLGDPRPIAECRRAVLTRSIFGVDLNPTAVWLCELRLWLSVVIESDERDPMQVTPLPNLDRHVRIGDALAGGGFDTEGPSAIRETGGRLIARLRDRYTRAVGPRKRTLVCALERAERSAAIAVAERALVRVSTERRELIAACRTPDLFGRVVPPSAATRARLTELRRASRELRARQRALRAGAALPFSFAAHFADVASEGGFHAVIGNPPWVRLREIAAPARARFRETFRVYRGAAWSAAVHGTRVGHGFAGHVDLAALFVERGTSLCRAGGIVGLLVPAKLWRSLAGGGVRRLLQEDTELLALEDWSDARQPFDAAVYPSLVIARRRPLRAAPDGPMQSAPPPSTPT